MGSKYEAIRGMSYLQIATIIDTLAAEIDAPAAPVQTLSAPPQSPQINFFADEDVVNESLQAQDEFSRDLQVRATSDGFV